MSDLVFVDTNVFIYALDPTDLKKQSMAAEWRSWLWRNGRGRISFQVLQEFYVKATQKWPNSTAIARAEVRDLLAWRPVVASDGILLESWKIQDRYRLSFWDALIVAAAKTASCRYLLTEDLQSAQNLDGVVVINPFRQEPSVID